jgi:hypothetical protein
LDLNSIVWVANDLDDFGLTSAADLPVQTVKEIQTAADKLPSPTLVTDAVRPKVVFIEWRIGRDCVSDETTRCVSVHAEQEWDEKVVGVPEGLK